MSNVKNHAPMEKVIDFLEKNVLGKSVFSEETHYDLEYGRFEGAYSTEISFSNLMQSETGFTMDGFTLSHEKIIEAGPGVLRKDVRLVSFFKYEFSRRASSGEITGFMRFVSSSAAIDPSPAEATVSSISGVTIKENELRWREDQILYRDQQNMDGTYSSKAFVLDNYLRMRNGKLEYGFTAECFSVDPKTMERKKALGFYSPFTAREK